MHKPALAAAAFLLSGCLAIPEGEPQEESRSIELGGAEMVRAVIGMKAGELNIRGGAERLMDAAFYYPGDRAKPQVRYNVTGFRGNLSIQQPNVVRTAGRHEWNLRLNNDVPMDLEVRLGAGESELELSGLHLRSLEVHLGAGELLLDLSGKWSKDFATRIRGGVGKATVRLPREVGVKAEARGGIGEINAYGLHKSGHIYTNDAYGKSPVTLNLDIKGGVGEIRLELTGETSGGGSR